MQAISPIGPYQALAEFELGERSPELAHFGLQAGRDRAGRPVLIKRIRARELSKDDLFVLDLQSCLFNEIRSKNFLHLTGVFQDREWIIQVFDYMPLEPVSARNTGMQDQLRMIMKELDAKKLEITNLSHNCFAASKGTAIITSEAKIVFNTARRLPNLTAFEQLAGPDMAESFSRPSLEQEYRPDLDGPYKPTRAVECMSLPR